MIKNTVRHRESGEHTIHTIMKKLLLLLTLLLATAGATLAQSVQVATLTHEGGITSFTGSKALRQAYDAAADGDIITLSSGTFECVNFEKRITVRGAGMGVKVNDSDPYIEPTILKGQYEIKADGDDKNIFKLEGILSEERVSLQGVFEAQFSKCRFDYLDYSAGVGSFERASFINCILLGLIIPENSNINFFGCYLKDLNARFNNNTQHNITNCILDAGDSGRFNENNCIIKNSIFLNTTESEFCDNKGTSFFSIWNGKIAKGSPFYNTQESHNNTIVPEGIQLFKEGTFYQLTDESKQYLGDDGTEVGIYGGSLPFDPLPTNPQITKFKVAPKTTADGKLSVDIEVNIK